jgi:hypothetical protein
MFRRIALALVTIVALAAGRAEAVTIRDLIELTKAGLSDPVLLALIEVDRGVFTIDTPTLKQLKDAGVSEAVIVALIRSGRTPPVQEPEAVPPPEYGAIREPEVIVIDHHGEPAAAPEPVAVPYPVAVPVYVGVPTRVVSAGRTGSSTRRHPGGDTVTTTFQTDVGVVKARVPLSANCVKAEPVYWGFGGKLRPGSWQPPPTVVCR